jgi:hypothetical protein
MSIVTDLMVAGGFAGLASKVLGPTAEYFGNGLATLAKKRFENLQRIFLKAEAKLGDRAKLPGAVPPRVLAGIVNDGSYCDDPLASEYFGGVLASSRSQIPRDDRAATLVSLVSRLSTYLVRLHYVVYRAFLELYGRSNATVTDSASRHLLKTFIPGSVLLSAMDFSDTEPGQAIMEHALIGLAREELIGTIGWGYGDAKTLRSLGYSGEGWGLVSEPSPNGVELFLNAMGAGYAPLNAFLHEGTSIAPLEGIVVQPGALPLKQPTKTPQ